MYTMKREISRKRLMRYTAEVKVKKKITTRSLKNINLNKKSRLTNSKDEMNLNKLRFFFNID
jgi:hypothetical protein